MFQRVYQKGCSGPIICFIRSPETKAGFSLGRRRGSAQPVKRLLRAYRRHAMVKERGLVARKSAIGIKQPGRAFLGRPTLFRGEDTKKMLAQLSLHRSFLPPKLKLPLLPPHYPTCSSTCGWRSKNMEPTRKLRLRRLALPPPRRRIWTVLDVEAAFCVA